MRLMRRETEELGKGFEVEVALTSRGLDRGIPMAGGEWRPAMSLLWDG